MRHIHPDELKITELAKLLTSAIAPRPIALVATISENGEPNLAPFSFFNMFGANPPMVAFSPSIRVRDGSHKDTYHNLVREKECTIQMVNFDMVGQVNLASTEYDTGVNEFIKSGLTPIPSDTVKPPRVKESPFQMECRLMQEVSLGNGKGAGNLMICRVEKIHVAEEVFVKDSIDPYRMDLVARMGENYYSRASGNALFELDKPSEIKGMGYDKLPEQVKQSHVFTANDLAQLAGAETLPVKKEVKELIENIKKDFTFDNEADLLQLFQHYLRMKDHMKMLAVALCLKKRKHILANQKIELAAQTALHNNDRHFAWKAISMNTMFEAKDFERCGM